MDDTRPGSVLDDDAGLRALLQRTASVAIVGVSADPSRASHAVAAYLLAATDWTIWFVNPTIETVLGRPCHPDLAALPQPPDVVDVFRRTEHLPGVVDDAIAIGAGTIWFQLGLVHDEAAETACRAGLDVVQDRCLKIDHARLL